MDDREKAYLEQHLNQEIRLLPRGDHDLAPYLTALAPPWRLALSSTAVPEEAVFAIWEPVLARARGFVTRLALATVDFALVVSPRNAFPPGLLYLLQMGAYARGWLAGPPAGVDDWTRLERRLGAPLPASYRLFTGVHDGFLERGNGAVGFAPLAALRRLSGRVEPSQPASAAPPPGPWGLLAFWADGPSGRQCFDLTAPLGQGDARTVFWDPAAGALSNPQSFWSFLKGLVVSGFPARKEDPPRIRGDMAS